MHDTLTSKLTEEQVSQVLECRVIATSPNAHRVGVLIGEHRTMCAEVLRLTEALAALGCRLSGS